MVQPDQVERRVSSERKRVEVGREGERTGSAGCKEREVKGETTVLVKRFSREMTTNDNEVRWFLTFWVGEDYDSLIFVEVLEVYFFIRIC